MELSVYFIHLYLVGTAFESSRAATAGPGRISKGNSHPTCGRLLFTVEIASRDPHPPRILGQPSVWDWMLAGKAFQDQQMKELPALDDAEWTTVDTYYAT